MDEDDISKLAETAITAESITQIIGALVEARYVRNIDWVLVEQLFMVRDSTVSNSGIITVPKLNDIISKIRKQVVKMSHLMEQVIKGFPEEILLYKELWYDSEIKKHIPTFNKFREICQDVQSMTSFPDTPLRQYLFLAWQYRTYKEAIGAVDFDDLLVKTYEEYRNDIDGKFKRYQWIQVDEVQDLSKFQIALIDELTKNEAVVVYFGDEQQAIYSFMGASLKVLGELKKRCQKIIRLDKNYRSPKYLLDVFNEYAIKQLGVDSELLPQAKDSSVASSEELKLVTCREKTEGEFLSNEIQNLSRYNERTAVLVAWNRDASDFSSILDRHGIKHFRISGEDIFKTVTMRMVLAHFNVVNNPLSTLSWANILHNSYAINKLGRACDFVCQMKKLGMTPEDLLRDDNSTYTREFCNAYQNEECVIFDTETTGLDIVNDDIVQIAAIKIRQGKIVPNSQFNIFLETQKKIPEMLGEKVNPMCEAYRYAEKVSRQEGLLRFCEYVGNLPIIGHNVNYDYNILRYNLKRELMLDLFKSNRIFDTLFLTRLLIPKLPIYKLEYLLNRLGLSGVNSHMANDDILATFELVKYCFSLLENKVYQQIVFLNDKKNLFIKKNLEIGYKDCYWHTKSLMWNDFGNETPVLVTEMKYVHDRLVIDCELAPVPYLDEYILKFVKNDVLEPNEQNMLTSQLSMHLMDLNTYKESDLCDSPVMKERVFVSTIHKAKGLEFENVILMRANNNRFPKFSSNTQEKIQEDKRLFYVAMSRAMKRLTISGTTIYKEHLTNFVKPIRHHFSNLLI